MRCLFAGADASPWPERAALPARPYRGDRMRSRPQRRNCPGGLPRNIFPIACLGLTALAFGAAAQTVLPQPDPPFRGKTAPDRAQSVADWPQQLHAPAGAPNVILVLLDDVGFGASGVLGGPASTPALDKLAAQGVRYNAFNTTAICSPTRASLLTGHNQHQARRWRSTRPPSML